MKNTLFKNGIILAIFVLFVGLNYFYEEDAVVVSTTVSPTNYQTIVLKDLNDQLIPVEVDLKVTSAIKDQVIASIEMMKSYDFTDIGLYPVFSQDVYVNEVVVDEDVLKISFNNAFVSNGNIEALDFAESLSYMFCKNEIEEVSILIDDEVILYIPNSTIPVSAITSNLGINNFTTQTNTIFKTVPIVVYNTNTIYNELFYVPETIRVLSQDDDYGTMVSKVLDYIDSDVSLVLEKVVYEQGDIEVTLDSIVLDEGEYIDTILFNQLVKSIGSIQGVENVSIYVDGNLQEALIDVSTKINNRIEL